MSTARPHYQSPAPGFLKSLLIHLSGADPKVFVHLPAHESTDYAKSGASVLIPFVLAFIAGTFTISTLQEQKDFNMALVGGAVWAIVILLIDVVVMNHLVKLRILPELPPEETGPDWFRPAAPVKKEPPIEPKEKSHWRNRFIATLRISIAVALGLVVSHSIVLLVFNVRIEQQVAESHHRSLEQFDGAKAEITELTQRIDAAQAVMGIPDDNIFLAQRALLPGSPLAPKDGGDSQTGPGPGGSPFSDDPVIQGLQSELLELSKTQEGERAEKDKDFRETQSFYQQVVIDKATAQSMVTAEEAGQLLKFIFRTPGELVGTFSTSGKSGPGSRTAEARSRLRKFEEMEKTEKKRADELERGYNELVVKQKDERATLEGKLKGAKDKWLGRMSSENTARFDKQTTIAKEARAALTQYIGQLKERRASEQGILTQKNEQV